MTSTHHIEIPPKFWFDHEDRCVERTIVVAQAKGNRVAVELTDAEVVDLHSDAIHYSDAQQFEYEGAAAMARSARAVRKAIEQQVPNLDALIEAKLEAARAYRESDEYKAMLAEVDASRAAADEALRLRDLVDPHVWSVKGRQLRIDGVWSEVVSLSWAWPMHVMRLADGRVVEIKDIEGGNPRCSKLGLEVAAVSE